VRRAQESGLGTGANVFVTKPALRGFERLLEILSELDPRHVRHLPRAPRNLRSDGAEAVLERALDYGPVSHEEIYFPNRRPSTRILARRYGDRCGTKLHFEPLSLRYLWLDQERDEPA
jgi:hypothetical protein